MQHYNTVRLAAIFETFRYNIYSLFAIEIEWFEQSWMFDGRRVFSSRKKITI